MIRRIGEVCVALLLCLGFMCGCSTQRKEKANDGKLLIYACFEHEQVSQYLAAFQKAHPDIEYEVIVDSHGVIMAKLLAERANPKADVIFGLSAFNMEQLKNERLLSPLTLTNLKAFNPQFVDSIDSKEKKPYYVGLSGVESVIIVNEKELAKKGLKTPSSYAELLEPQYKGLITMPNPSSSGTGFLSMVGFVSLMGEKGAWEYMSALDKNIALYTHSGSKPARLAASGEYPIGISLGYRGHKMLKDSEPIAMIFPKEGYGWDLESLALVRKDSIKPSAIAFIEWASSESAMKEYASNNVLVAIPTNTPTPLGYEAKPRIIHIDFATFAKERDSMLKQWDKQFQNKSEAK